MPDELQIRLVRQVEPVVRLGEQCHEGGGLFEELREAVALCGVLAQREHFLVRFGASAENPENFAGIVAIGRVGEGEPGLFREAMTIHQQR